MSLIDREVLSKAVEESRVDNPHKDGKIATNHEFEHRHFLNLIANAPVEQIRINLNEVVKFKLTDLGKDVFYHQYDEVNEWIRNRGGRPLEPTMPKVDADGYTEMQLWNFMEVFGSYFGMAKPSVISPLEIIYNPE